MNLRHRYALAALFVSVPIAAGNGRAAGDDFASRRALFQYDSRADLKVREAKVEESDQAVVHDLSFAATPDVPETRAYLVVPKLPGPFAGVLWVHWLGEPATSNRSEFKDEAVALAPRGVVSLLVDAMWGDPRWYASRVPEQDRQNSIRQVVALRRALDLLAAQPGVDGARLGFVGHDFGAMYGMIMGGVDGRPRAYVFATPTPSLSDWAFFAKQPASKAEYLRQNADLELTDYLSRLGGAATLFQFAARDPYVSEAGGSVLLAAAPGRRQRRVYEGDHNLEAPEAARDRAEWLATELGLAAGSRR
jgi:dienelactone hydrolase